MHRYFLSNDKNYVGKGAENGKLISIANIATGNIDNLPVEIKSNGHQADMWIEKLGRSNAAGRILQFLSEKAGLGFTKSQVALAAQMSVKGGAFNEAMSLLKRNNLIKVENRLFFINPDLK